MKEWEVLINNNIALWDEVKKINLAYRNYYFNKIYGYTAFEYSTRTNGARFTKHFSIEPVPNEFKNTVFDRFDFGKFLRKQILDNFKEYKLLIDKYIKIFEAYCKYKTEINTVFERLRVFKNENVELITSQKRKVVSKLFVSDSAYKQKRYMDFCNKQSCEEEILKKHMYNPFFPCVKLYLYAVTPWRYHEENFIYEFQDIVTCYNMVAKQK